MAIMTGYDQDDIFMLDSTNLPINNQTKYFGKLNNNGNDSGHPTQLADDYWRVENNNGSYTITLLQDAVYDEEENIGQMLIIFGNVVLNLDDHTLTLNSSGYALQFGQENYSNYLTISGNEGVLNLNGCGLDNGFIYGVFNFDTNNDSTVIIDSGVTLNIINKGDHPMFTHFLSGSPQFKVKDGATVNLKNEGAAVGQNFVDENSNIQFSYHGTPISIGDINLHKNDSSWTIWTEMPDIPTVSGKTEKKEDKNEPQSKPDTSKKSDYAADVIRVCFPGQDVWIPLKAFKTDEKTTKNINLTMTSYAANLSKTAQLLDSFTAEPPLRYIQGKEIQFTIKNPNIKAGDTLVLNIYNEFDTPATQEFYTGTATKDGEVTFTIKHIGLMSLFRIK